MFNSRVEGSSLVKQIGRDCDGKLQSRLLQTDRIAILQDVQGMRNAGVVQDREGLGRWALTIPNVDYSALVEKYPELQAPDNDVRQHAWRLFLASDESAPYRVRENAC